MPVFEIIIRPKKKGDSRKLGRASAKSKDQAREWARRQITHLSLQPDDFHITVMEKRDGKKEKK